MNNKYSLFKNMKKWCQGEYTSYGPNSPIVGSGHLHQPLLARIINRIIKFSLDHWKWIIGFILSIIGLIIANKKYS